MSSHNSLPATCRALVYQDPGKLSVQNVPVPEVTPGSVIVKILYSNAQGLKRILAGKASGLHIPSTFTPGARAIGRIAVVGPDTTTLEEGQLVMIESFVRGRDNPDVKILLGLGIFENDAAAEKLMDQVWRDGTSAEYIRAPLENCYALNEKRLCGSPSEGGLGYSIADLAMLPTQLVAYGGFRGINLQPGETVIIAPATGTFSGAAVDVAVAMGARVIAMGRNVDALRRLQSIYPSINIVQTRNNYEEDLASLKQFGPIDAYIDISPIAANESSYIRSCLMALRPYGRASLMGVISKDVAIPYMFVMLRNLTIRGQYMYEREDARGLVKLAESGALRLGKQVGHEIVNIFKFEEFEKALEASENSTGVGKLVLFEA